MNLTPDNMETLLEEVKSYLNITWTDEAVDNQLKRFIKRGIARLEDVYGAPLKFIDDGRHATVGSRRKLSGVDYLAQDLLNTYVFYANEKALDDWESNYRMQLLTLRSKGKVNRMKEKECGCNAPF